MPGLGPGEGLQQDKDIGERGTHTQIELFRASCKRMHDRQETRSDSSSQLQGVSRKYGITIAKSSFVHPMEYW